MELLKHSVEIGEAVFLQHDGGLEDVLGDGTVTMCRYSPKKQSQPPAAIQTGVKEEEAKSGGTRESGSNAALRRNVGPRPSKGLAVTLLLRQLLPCSAEGAPGGTGGDGSSDSEQVEAPAGGGGGGGGAVDTAGGSGSETGSASSPPTTAAMLDAEYSANLTAARSLSTSTPARGAANVVVDGYSNADPITIEAVVGLNL